MTSAEMTSETFGMLAPGSARKVVYIQCTTTNAADFVTLTSYFTTLDGAYLISTGGTVATFATVASTTVLTFANGATGTKIWSGFAWGTG